MSDLGVYILFGFSEEKGFIRFTKVRNGYFCRKSDFTIANFTLNKIIPINLFLFIMSELRIQTDCWYLKMSNHGFYIYPDKRHEIFHDNTGTLWIENN